MLLLVSLSKPSGAPGTHVPGAGGQTLPYFGFGEEHRIKNDQCQGELQQLRQACQLFHLTTKFPRLKIFSGSERYHLWERASVQRD